MHHRSIRTEQLLVCSSRRLGHFLLEALHFPLTHRQRCFPCLQRCSLHRREAFLDPYQVLEQFSRLLKRHPACQPYQRFLPTWRQPSTQQP